LYIISDCYVVNFPEAYNVGLINVYNVYETNTKKIINAFIILAVFIILRYPHEM